MASRSLGILRRAGQVLKQRLRLPRVPRTELPPTRTPAYLANRIVINRAPRTIFQSPYAFNSPSAARLGFCVELAPLATGSRIAFPSMNRIASNCLASVAENDGKEHLEITSLEQLDTGPFLKKGCNGAVYAARFKTEAENPHRLLQPDLSHWPLVFKMVFNFFGDTRDPTAKEVEEMFRAETVPVTILPKHPCVAKFVAYFVDNVPRLPRALEEFPVACPRRLYPDEGDLCLGGEKTLFVVMKRYSSSLSERLAAGPLASEDAERILLQLLEANVVLQRHGVAHRDLHEKNVLLTERTDGKLSACIADFGCSTTRLLRPQSAGFDPFSAPGNGCLQAPECSDPTAPRLDYRKSDLWAIGAMAYSLFSAGEKNPFINKLDPRSYHDSDLPNVPGAPQWLNRLVLQMLRRDPLQRPSGTLCADIMQLQALEPPSNWLLGPRVPDTAELRNWLLLKATELMLTFRRDEDSLLRLYFFDRMTEAGLAEALAWLREAFGKSSLGRKVAEMLEPEFDPAIVSEEERREGED